MGKPEQRRAHHTEPTLPTRPGRRRRVLILAAIVLLELVGLGIAARLRARSPEDRADVLLAELRAVVSPLRPNIVLRVLRNIGLLHAPQMHFYSDIKQDLHALGPEAVPRLAQALADEDENEEVRVSAAEVLGWIGDPRAVEPLLAVLKDESLGFRESAALALGVIGNVRAVEPLLAALGDENATVRRAAAEALGMVGGAKAAEALAPLLEDSDSDVQAAAAWALGMLGDSRGLAVLTQNVRGGNALDALTATVALARLGTPEARDVLRLSAPTSPHEGVRRFAARALETSCVQALVAAIDRDEANWAGDMVELLGVLRATEALPALDAVAANNPDADMRFQARMAARRIRRLAGSPPP